MFCLESVKSTELAFNPIGCTCNFKSHGTCLQAWFEQKHQFECPICHTLSVPNPVEAQQVIRIVYVQNDEVPHYNQLVDYRHQKCIGFCCFSLILWGIIVTIIDLVRRS